MFPRGVRAQKRGGKTCKGKKKIQKKKRVMWVSPTSSSGGGEMDRARKEFVGGGKIYLEGERRFGDVGWNRKENRWNVLQKLFNKRESKKENAKKKLQERWEEIRKKILEKRKRVDKSHHKRITKNKKKKKSQDVRVKLWQSFRHV